MSKKLALLAAPVIALAASSSANSSEWGDWSSVKPYVGVDAEWRHMNFKRGYGDNVFKRNTPQGNAYVGVRLSDYFAIEAGYQAAKKKSRSCAIKQGDLLLGFDPTDTSMNLGAAGFPDTLNIVGTTQIKGAHLNLLGILPVWGEYRIQLIGSVGYASLKAKQSLKVIDATGGGVPTIQFNGYDAYSKRKNVLKLGAGLQHMLTDNWGIRAMFKWENTQRIQIPGTLFQGVDPNTMALQTATVRLKNSTIYSLGTFFTF